MATDILLDMLELLRTEEDRSRTSVMYRTVSLLVEMVLNPLGVAIIAEQETVQNATTFEELGIVRLTSCFLGILELLTCALNAIRTHAVVTPLTICVAATLVVWRRAEDLERLNVV